VKTVPEEEAQIKRNIACPPHKKYIDLAAAPGKLFSREGLELYRGRKMGFR
jgi:hypothetical protein